MTKDLLLAAVFLLNIGLMAFIALDVLKRRKDSPAEKTDDTLIISDEALAEASSAPVKKAGIGKSKYSVNDVRKMVAKATEAVVVEYFNEDIDINDVEFDTPDETPAQSSNPAALSPEEIKKAFETDQRLADEIAASDDSVAEPIAEGATFDELARAELILGRKSTPTAEEHQYVVRVFADFKNTELMNHLPRYILDKLDECHRKVDEMTAAKESSRLSGPETVSVKAYGEFELIDFLPKYQKHNPTPNQ